MHFKWFWIILQILEKTSTHFKNKKKHWAGQVQNARTMLNDAKQNPNGAETTKKLRDRFSNRKFDLVN